MKATLLLGALLLAALVVGAWRFPHALDVHGAEHDTVTLNNLLDHGVGAEANDWFRIAPATLIDERGADGLELITPRTARRVLELASRPLPVVPHQCYSLTFGAAVQRPGAFGAIADENMVRAITTFHPANGSNVVRFRTAGRARVTVAIWGDRGSALVLRHVALRRLGSC